MKTFIRTIVVLVALNLVVVTLGVDTVETAPKNVEPAKAEMETAKKDMKEAGEKMREAGERMREAVQRETERAQRETERALRKAEHKLLVQPPSSPSIAGTREYSGTGRVLVIPTAEMKVQDLVMIMEDMNIMSRIFDKKLKEANLIPGFGGYSSGVFFSWNRIETKAFYLVDYGAFFLMKVNFPLSPPAETEEKQTEEDVDLIWEQTKQEIYEPEDIKRTGRRKRTTKRSRKEYDADKVENLKRTLIRVLKHAANIQNLKPNEWIILTVIGETEQTGEVILSRIYTVIKGNDVIYDQPLLSETGFSSPTVLTMRVIKSDVDAFSKGKLDFEQFHQRVQIFIY